MPRFGDTWYHRRARPLVPRSGGTSTSSRRTSAGTRMAPLRASSRGADVSIGFGSRSHQWPIG